MIVISRPATAGRFFGFKLHLIFHDRGELLNLMLTPGNVDEGTVFFQHRQPVPKMVRKLFGKLFGDRDYIFKKLEDELLRSFTFKIDYRHPFQYEKCVDAFD